MPFFSVIMPLYNKASFVVQAIDSVLNQSFSDFELIVVDDCSTDNSLELVKKMDSTHITIIEHKHNKGLSAARNTGIRHANSEYVTLLDADDFWDFGFLEKIKSLITTFPDAKLFATNYLELYSNGRLVLPKNSFGNAGIVRDFFGSNLGKPIYCSCSLCIHKSVFDICGFYDENISFGEDVDFNIRINTNFKLAYSNVGLMVYRMFSENQITNSFLTGKTITNFDHYEELAKTNKSLKMYLDFSRYVMAKTYKLEQNQTKFLELTAKINPKNLNFKQKLLLQMPVFLLSMIKRIKLFFNHYDIQINSYSKNI